MVGVEYVDEVNDESTCRQINSFKSDSDEIYIISESELLRTKICRYKPKSFHNLCTSVARNSLRKTLFSARSGKSGKMETIEMFPFRILSLITSLRTCTDLNRSINENDERAAVPLLEVELSFSLTLLSFLILITWPRNLVTPMKLKIRLTISSYVN